MRRRTRRALVAAALAICGLLVVTLPLPLHGSGILPVLSLTGLDVALVRATRGLAFARGRSLDEREAAARDLAYRRGFRLLGLAIVLVVFAASIATSVGAFIVNEQPDGLPQVDAGMSARLVVVLVELLAMLPTMVLAWTEPDRTDEESAVRPGGPARLARSVGAAVVLPAALVALWLAAVAWTPVQTAAASRQHAVSGGESPGVDCRHFATGGVVGVPLGAMVGMRAHVCWNGRQAYVLDDSPELTACGADDIEDFAVVSDLACTAATDAGGTLYYAVRARVSPLPLSIAVRDVRLDLVVTRDGRVLRQP